MAGRLPERTSPELVYLETKFAALVCYGLSVQLLQEVLPIGQTLSTTTIRQQVRRTAERCDKELAEGGAPAPGGCPDDGNRTFQPAVPFVIGLDGAYVHAKGQRSRREGWFEVIVGKSLPTHDKGPKCPFIPNYGLRYRRGKTISTAFVESAVNQVVSRRFVKKQQMRWPPAGAHHLLQIRTQVLNVTWRSTLSRWHPGMPLPPKPNPG